MNNSVTNKNGNERIDIDSDEKRNKFQSEIKFNNRIHRKVFGSSNDSNLPHRDINNNIESNIGNL